MERELRIKISRIIFIIVAMLLFIVLFSNSVFALEADSSDQSDNAVTTEEISEPVLEISRLMEKAKSYSYELQIGAKTREINTQGIKIERSEYYPKLNLQAGTEYTKNMRDNNIGMVTTVGDMFLNPYTRYQSIMGLVLSYNLFDFGVRRGKLDIAKASVQISEIEEQEKCQDIYLKVLDVYTKILVIKKQIDINEEILQIEKSNLELQNRLYKAKQITKNDLNNSEVKVAKVQRRINELRSILLENLENLSYYTGEKYDIADLKIKESPTPQLSDSDPDYTNSIVWKLYEKQIKKKDLEIKVLKRSNYPKVTAYGRYYLYGSDPSSYGSSLGDISASNYTIGGTVSMPIFDGLKNREEIKKAEIEKSQLEIERDKSMAEYKMRLMTLRHNLVYENDQIKTDNEILKSLNEKVSNQTRLLSKKLISPTELNDAKIEKLEQEIELTKDNLMKFAIVKSIQILTEVN